MRSDMHTHRPSSSLTVPGARHAGLSCIPQIMVAATLMAVRLGAQTTDRLFDVPTFKVGFAPTGIVIADFNADDKLDMATANSGPDPATVTVLLGQGDGGFTSQGDLELSQGIGSYSIVSADF